MSIIIISRKCHTVKRLIAHKSDVSKNSLNFPEENNCHLFGDTHVAS